MDKKTILVPNLLILIYTLIMYHGSLFSGHINRTVLLLLLCSVLTILYCLLKKMWIPVKITAALSNLVLFCMFSYTFAGISNMLIKHDSVNPVIYAAVIIIFLFIILTIVLRKKAASIAFNAALLIFALSIYLLWSSMPLRANFNAAIFGTIALIGALNVYNILFSIIKRK